MYIEINYKLKRYFTEYRRLETKRIKDVRVFVINVIRNKHD